MSLDDCLPMGRAAMVVAHPDDEVLALGGQFRRLHPRIFHLTSGAFLHDERRLGPVRRRELNRALALGRIPARHRFSCDLPDQAAVGHLPEALAALLRFVDTTGAQSLVTHSYEGGHPDHDAAALLCARAVALRPGVACWEFPSYHNATPFGACGTWRVGGFLTVGDGEIVLPLSEKQRREKIRMLKCFRSQADVTWRFAVSPERLRPAPAYDFSKPPHAGRLLYEAFGWSTFEAWVKAT